MKNLSGRGKLLVFMEGKKKKKPEEKNWRTCKVTLMWIYKIFD